MRGLAPYLVAATLIAACAQPQGESAEFFVFGTLLEVQLPDAEADEATEIFADLHREFRRMHEEWHAWEPGELTRLNDALRSGRAVQTTADIADLLRRSQQLERKSSGRFNPAIGRLISLWGFHTSEFPVTAPPPDTEAIEAVVGTRPSSLDVTINGRVIRSSNPAVQFDFGGIAKGFATDMACEFIRRRGQHSAIVNAGGDMRVIGDNRGRPWRIAVRDPAGGIAGTIEVAGDRAVFTSGNYERYKQDDSGERYPHILDPRTGWPVRDVSSATVIAANGTIADAAATAIVVAGPEEGPQVAADMGIQAVLVIDESGTMRATEAMMTYFTPSKGREVTLVERK